MSTTQTKERKNAAKAMEEDLILKWAAWGWDAKKIMESSRGILANSWTLAKIQKVVGRGKISV